MDGSSGVDEVSIAVINTKLDNMLGMLTSVTSQQASLENRVRGLESTATSVSTRLDVMEKEDWRLVMARKPAAWPAVAQAIVGMATLLMVIAGLLYLGPH